MVSVRDLLVASVGDGSNLPDLPSASWAHLPGRAREHGLTMRVNPLLPGTTAPPAVREEVKVDSLRGIAGQLQIRADLRRLAAVLDAAGLTWAAVKGPVLSDYWYAVPAQRDYVDLDVVVDPAQFGAVLDVLEANGAELVDRNFGLALHQGRAELSLILPGGSALDLHWHVLNTPRLRADFPLSVRSMLDRRQTAGLDRTAVPTFDAADSLVHLCLHTILSGGQRLCWYRDIHEVVSNGAVAWEQVIDRARESRSGLVVAVALTRTRRLTGLDVPDDVLATLADAGRGWTAAISGLDALRPLGGQLDARLSGALAVQASRGSTGASVATLAHSIKHDLWLPLLSDPHHPWRHRRRPESGRARSSPLAQAGLSSTDRNRYIDYVTSQANTP